MSELGQPDHHDEQQLRNSIKRAAVLFALISVVATSGIFFTVTRQSEQSSVEIQARRAVHSISEQNSDDPDAWWNDDGWLNSMVRGLHEPDQGGWHEILDRSGQPVARAGEHPGSLGVFAEAPILIGGEVVGTVKIGQFPYRAIKAALFGLLAGLILSGGVVLILWILPMRALNAAAARTDDYRIALQSRVAELELEQDLMERQGTELSQTAESLFHAREMERKANIAKSEFVANMSHELRTPLNSIIGFSEIMKLESFGPMENQRYREYAGHIHESGNHLLGLINDLLDLAKVEAGKLELEESEVDFAYVMRGCRNLLDQNITAGSLNFAEIIPPQLPLVMADERKLRQILFNLLSNAIKHTQPEGSVSVQAWVDPAGRFSFCVTDSGVGMAAEDIPKALEPFGQVENPMETGAEGTGLGLPLTKRLVELHGGTITLVSIKGVGTTATVILPAERVQEPAQQDTGQHPETGPGAARAGPAG